MSLYRFGPAPMGGFPSELEYQWDDFFRRRHFIYAAVGHLPRCNHKDFILWFLSGELPVEIKPASPDHQFVTAAVERANGREDHLLVIEGSPFGYAMWYWWPAADAAQALPGAMGTAPAAGRRSAAAVAPRDSGGQP